MAKRTRGSSTRPGQRARLQRAAAARAADAAAATPTVKPAGLTADEEARAAQLEAQIMAEERATETRGRRDRERARRAPAEPAVRSGTIASRAAAEYAYVMRDVRRIVVIGGGLVVALIALWAIITATGVGPF